MKLMDSAPSIILDLDDVVSNFETNIVCFVPPPPPQSSFDWFDPMDFPPLEASVRKDWTLDITEDGNTPLSVLDAEEGNEEGYPRTSLIANNILPAGDSLLTIGIATSSPCRPSAQQSVSPLIHDISEVVIEGIPEPSWPPQPSNSKSFSSSPINIIDYS